MRKLSFAVALLCCSQVALAADTCTVLNGVPMSIDANGYQAITGNINFFPNTQSFITTITFTGQGPDIISGTCKNGHLTFMRTHLGQGSYVQNYDGSATDFLQEKIKGTYSTGGTSSHSWSGLVLYLNNIANSSSSTTAQVASCQQNCFRDFAVEKPGGTGVLICKKECQDCKSKCH